MIVSHKYRYVFMELPHTGSTAVSRELRENYDGTKIHGKHSTYQSFVRSATEEEKQYFTFSAVRNPLDVAVTKYVKYVNNHNGRFTDPVKLARNRGLGNWVDRRLQRRIVENDLEFSEFFLDVYRFPFNTWASLDHQEFDFVMRFENLQEDFSKVLDLMGIEQVRPLPVVNASSRQRDFTSYYSPAAIERAKSVFAGYMREWDYRFPEAWGQPEYSSVDHAKYVTSTAIIKLYWQYLKRFLVTKDWEAAPPQRSSVS